MRLDKPMLLQLFLNGKKTVEFDGKVNFTREIYYGGRRNTFDGQYGGQVYFKLPAVTIPPGETFISCRIRHAASMHGMKTTGPPS
jgi:hypothetical protein